ncbi:hypothetical protein MMC25_007407 [Agyrium rufum]|nr:hypothetical protein [Agyrium rufum]
MAALATKGKPFDPSKLSDYPITYKESKSRISGNNDDLDITCKQQLFYFIVASLIRAVQPPPPTGMMHRLFEGADEGLYLLHSKDPHGQMTEISYTRVTPKSVAEDRVIVDAVFDQETQKMIVSLSRPRFELVATSILSETSKSTPTTTSSGDEDGVFDGETGADRDEEDEEDYIPDPDAPGDWRHLYQAKKLASSTAEGTVWGAPAEEPPKLVQANEKPVKTNMSATTKTARTTSTSGTQKAGSAKAANAALRQAPKKKEPPTARSKTSTQSTTNAAQSRRDHSVSGSPPANVSIKPFSSIRNSKDASDSEADADADSDSDDNILTIEGDDEPSSRDRPRSQAFRNLNLGGEGPISLRSAASSVSPALLGRKRLGNSGVGKGDSDSDNEIELEMGGGDEEQDAEEEEEEDADVEGEGDLTAVRFRLPSPVVAGTKSTTKNKDKGPPPSASSIVAPGKKGNKRRESTSHQHHEPPSRPALEEHHSVDVETTGPADDEDDEFARQLELEMARQSEEAEGDDADAHGDVEEGGVGLGVRYVQDDSSSESEAE